MEPNGSTNDYNIWYTIIQLVLTCVVVVGIVVLFVVIAAAISIHRKIEQENDPVLQETQTIEMATNVPWQYLLTTLRILPKQN